MEIQYDALLQLCIPLNINQRTSYVFVLHRYLTSFYPLFDLLFSWFSCRILRRKDQICLFWFITYLFGWSACFLGVFPKRWETHQVQQGMRHLGYFSRWNRGPISPGSKRKLKRTVHSNPAGEHDRAPVAEATHGQHAQAHPCIWPCVVAHSRPCVWARPCVGANFRDKSRFSASFAGNRSGVRLGLLSGDF